MAKKPDDDNLTERLRSLTGELPTPRKNLSEAEKDSLIKTIGGPLTVESVLKAKKDFSTERIPFLFSSLDTQAVVDILANDMTSALLRAKKP